jgi:AcrR family transcriptional regulator
VHGPGFPIRTLRDRVLAATVRVIADRGYAAPTLDEIAAEAFLPPGDVFELVGDKDACFLAAFSASTQRAHLIALERFDGDAPWPVRLRDALAAFLEAFTVFLEPGMRMRGHATLDAEIVAGGVFHVLHRYAREDRVACVQEALPELTRVVLAPFCDPAEIASTLVPLDI